MLEKFRSFTASKWPTHLFKIYIDALPKKLEILPGFIISMLKLNNNGYAEDTVLMVIAEIKLQVFLDGIEEQIVKKVQTVKLQHDRK